MDSRRNPHVAAFIAVSPSYVLSVLAFTGTFDVFRWFVFTALFLGFTEGYGGTPWNRSRGH